MPRDLETRENEERSTKGYVPPSALPTPPSRDGYVFRWVRVSILNESDKSNVSKRLREGWEPCKVEDFPELQVQFSLFDDDNRYAKLGLIEVGGLILCRMTEEQAQAREEYYNRMSKAQLQALDGSTMEKQDPRMPWLSPHRTTRTTFHRAPARQS